MTSILDYLRSWAEFLWLSLGPAPLGVLFFLAVVILAVALILRN